MSMKYIRDTYGIPIKRGMRVRTERGEIGWITSATHHVRVRWNVHEYERFHPRDLYYFIDGEWRHGNDFANKSITIPPRAIEVNLPSGGHFKISVGKVTLTEG